MARNNAALLPLIPHIFFLYLEPVAISYGIAMTLSQASPIMATPVPVAAAFLPAQQSGFLVCMILYGLIILLAAPPNRWLLKAHIWVLIAADVVHWAGLAWTIGQMDPAGRGWAAAVMDTTGWDANLWNLATYPLGTLAVKILTLAGVVGEIKAE